MIKKMTEFYVYETVDFSINLTSKTQIAILEDVKDLVISFKQVIKNAYRNNRAFLEKNLSSDDIELDIENSRLNVHLSQEDTSKFIPNNIVQVQINILYNNEERDTSVKGEIMALDNLHEEVMT